MSNIDDFTIEAKYIVRYPSMMMMDFSNADCYQYKLGERFQILNTIEDLPIIRDGLITIGGENSSGKTSFVCDLALNILQSEPDTIFIMYSTDDSPIKTAQRIFSQLSDRNMFKFKISNSDKEKYSDVFRRIFLLSDIDINQIEAIIDEITKNGRPKLIIGIDYLQNIPLSGERKNFNDSLLALKRLQKRLEERYGGCILFCLSQLGRDRTSGGMRYRESSEIENQSDVCMDIEPPPIIGDQKQTPDPTTPERIIKIQKNKLGSRGIEFETELSKTFKFKTLSVREKSEPAISQAKTTNRKQETQPRSKATTVLPYQEGWN